MHVCKMPWVYVQSLYAIQVWECVGSALKKRNVAKKKKSVWASLRFG